MRYLITDFIKYINVEKNYSFHTLKNYEHDLNIFKDFMKNKNIHKIDYSDIRNYLSHLYKLNYFIIFLNLHLKYEI